MNSYPNAQDNDQRRNQQNQDAAVEHVRTFRLLRRRGPVTHYALRQQSRPAHTPSRFAFAKYRQKTSTSHQKFRKCEYIAAASAS
jgi:hypothetical protein